MAFASGGLVAHANFTYFQSDGPVLKFVITPTCKKILDELPPSKLKSPWFPLAQSMVKVRLELSCGNSGDQVNSLCDLAEKKAIQFQICPLPGH